jgi:hypothetical protein
MSFTEIPGYSWVIILTNAVVLVMSLIMIYLKLRYK